MVENVYRNTKMRFDSIWTSILREIDVDLTSMCWKNTLRTKKSNSGNRVRLATVISCLHNCMFLAKLFEIS